MENSVAFNKYLNNEMNMINTNPKKLQVIPNCETKLLPEGLLKDLNYDESEDEDDSDSDDQVCQFLADKNKFVNISNKFSNNQNQNNLDKRYIPISKKCNKYPNISGKLYPNNNPNFIRNDTANEININTQNAYLMQVLSSPQNRIKALSHNNFIKTTVMKPYSGDNTNSYFNNNFYNNHYNMKMNNQNFNNNNFNQSACINNFGVEEQFMNNMIINNENSIPVLNTINNCKIKLIFRL